LKSGNPLDFPDFIIQQTVMTIARKLNFSGFAPKFCGLGSDISFAESDNNQKV